MRFHMQKPARLSTIMMALSLPLGLACSAVAHADEVIIDLFTATQVAADVVNGGAGVPQSTATGLASILGGQRDIFVDALSGASDVNANGICDVGDKCTVMSAAVGSLRFNNDTGVTGRGIIQWDGPDQDIALIPDGLGGIDLTAGGTATGFQFTVDEADQPFIFTLEAYTDADHFTIFTIRSSVVAPGFPLTRTIAFSAFENPAFCDNPGATGDPQILDVKCGPSNQTADFNNLGALQVKLNQPDESGNRTVALDLKIHDIIAPKEDGRGRVAPTGTDCNDFVNDDPASILDSFTMTVKNNLVTNVTPGAAFYFTRFGASGDFTVGIEQSSTGGSQYEMDLTDWQLFTVVSTSSGFVCEVVDQDQFANAALTDQSLSFTGLPVAEYAMRIRMAPKSIINEADPGADLTNNFQTFVNGSLVDEDPDGVLLDRTQK